MRTVLVTSAEIKEIRDAAAELRRIGDMVAGVPRFPGNPNSIYGILPPLAIWLDETASVLEEDPEVTVNAVSALRVARCLR